MTLVKNKPALARNRWQLGLVLGLVLSVVLAACGDTPTAEPTVTPSPKFQQENSRELFFTMNVPFGWARKQDGESLSFTDTINKANSVGVVSRRIGKLTPGSRRLLEETVDRLKALHPELREDAEGGGTLTLLDTTVPITRLSYKLNDVEVYHYLSQVNNVKAERAYILYGTAVATEVEKLRPIYIEAFRSFTSNAAAVIVSGETGVADPTVVAANAGGTVLPRGGTETKGKVLRLVDWETPPLNANAKTPRLKGQFPYEYGWVLKPFPSLEQPAIYLRSPKVDRSGNEAIIQIGVYRGVLPTGALNAADWQRFYDPVFKTLVNDTLTAYGQPKDIKLGQIVTNADGVQMPFVVTTATGDLQTRGIILVSRNTTNAIVSMVSLSQAASVRQDLYEAYIADLQTLVKTLSVQF